MPSSAGQSPGTDLYGEFSTDHVEGSAWVRGRLDMGPGEPRSTIRFAHVATTQAGTELVQCYRSGGSGVFGYVSALGVTKEEVLVGRYRIALKILGGAGLGDGSFGRIHYDGRLLGVGPDRG